ncbi:MAG: MFS transporter [Candidatus Nitrohelix vancouverensis]|uniref:MFS transporter n=1 Tax=Candidatus Nitrohelix vancouverensis TaxID=2705534 RepID=A0A7T0C1I5_9BACT|nr:MAG: MFS transporter [Candidatus Nitrohelix vancouverensis]
MKAALSPLFALLLSAAFLLTGNGLQGILTPIRANMEGFSAMAIGFLGSTYFSGTVIGCLVCPHMVKRVGHIRSFVVLAATASAAILIQALLIDQAVWGALRMVMGFCFAGLAMVIESWLNDKTNNNTRGQVLSIYTTINFTVITVGQLMLNWSLPSGTTLFIVVSILLSISILPVALTQAMAPPPLLSVKLRIRWLLNTSVMGCAGCFCVGLANGAFWTLGPVFALESGMSIPSVTIFMSVAVLGGAVSQWPIGKISDAVDRRKVIGFCCLLAGSMGLGLAWAHGHSVSATLILVFMFGVFAFPLYSLSVAHANDSVDREDFVEVSSGLLLIFGIGAITGPLVASKFIHHFGQPSLFVYTALIHGLTGALAYYRITKRERVPAEEREDFIPVSQTSPEVNLLDPRSGKHP